MKKAFTIFIGFIHDFAAGCWAATVLVIYWLNRIPDKDLSDVLTDIKKDFFYISLICVVIVFLAGIGRTFTYISNVYGEDAERTRRKMLIVKHVALLLVFGIGIYWQYTMVFE
ncbi:MAG: hypothetical protein HZB61_02575 [Nitrospirae bacterium]|nr:hypothetical protein [Nitrospirota bacterium]